MNSEQEVNIKEKIHRYINGELNEQETEELWAVLVKNDEYYDYMQTAANLKAINGSESAVPVPFLRKVAYAGAAVLLLLITVFGLFKLMNSQPAPSVQPISSIELPFQRSVDVSTTVDDGNIIRKAILLNYNNKFNKAVGLLQNELKKANNADYRTRLNIMLGVLYYNKKMFEEAKKYFLKVLSDKNRIGALRLEKAYWYLANTWIQLSKVEKAKYAIKKVIEIDGAYSRVAHNYLKALKNKQDV